MSLSGVVSKGLVSGSVGRQFGRSTSCGDLTTVPVPANKDGIQLYVSTPGVGTPIRMLASDSISAVSMKIKAPSRGFYSKQQCIVPGSLAADDSMPRLAGSANDRRIVMGLSDLLHLSVSTASGKEYAYAESRPRAAVFREDRIVEEELGHESCPGGELTRVSSWAVCEHANLDPADAKEVSWEQCLHLVASRSNSKLHVRPVNKGSCLELSIQAAPSISRSSSWRSDLPSPRSPLLDDGVSVQKDDVLPALLGKVEEGLVSGATPELTQDGSGGTYFMSDTAGRKVAVFKPIDEEPLAINCPRGMVPSSTGEGLKKGTRVGEGAYREVAAYLLDHPGASSKLNEGFSGVPATTLSCLSRDFFSAPDEVQGNHTVFLPEMEAWKLGSLQEFVPALSNCEDMGPQRFSPLEVHKIAVLDMRLGNADRNGANILVQQEGSTLKLIPIDHGYCLPETLEDCTFEWLYWPQAKTPFNQETLEYIASLNADEDIELLRTAGWNVSDAVARTLRVCTLLLKKGAARGLAPYAIGSKMTREDFERPSVLEEIIDEAEAYIDREQLDGSLFMAIFTHLMDEHLSMEQ